MANPTLDPMVVDNLRAGRYGSLDKTYQGMASLAESFLRGDPIATTDVNNRLAAYAAVFAGYAQAAAEIVALVQANPGTIVYVLTSPDASAPTQHRQFN